MKDDYSDGDFLWNTLGGSLKNYRDESLNLKKHEEDRSIYSAKIKLQASSGYFVRQLGNDLKRIIKFPLMIFDINRTGIDLKD